MRSRKHKNCSLKIWFFLRIFRSTKSLIINEPFSVVEIFHFLMVCHSIFYHTFQNKFSKSYAKTLIFNITPWNSCRSLTLASKPYLPNQNLVIMSLCYFRPVCKALQDEKTKAYNNTLDIFTYLDLFQVWFTLILQIWFLEWLQFSPVMILLQVIASGILTSAPLSWSFICQ